METETTEIAIAGHSLIRPLLSGPNGSVYLAVRTPGTGQVLVKTFCPPILTDDAEASADHFRRVTKFLDAARMQKELAGQSKSSWAVVHDLGPLAGGDDAESGGAFFTTDSFPASLEWLIKAKVSVDGCSLQAVIAGVTAGLVQIQKKFGRGHGSLIPVNVVLRRRDLRSPRVLLTDPHPEPSADGDSDDTDDRLAVGSLIYSLVIRKPVRRMMLLPVEMSADWARLGKNAAKWLDLCNRLLSRNRADRPELTALVAEVSALRDKDRRKTFRRRMLAAAVVALVASAGLAGYVHLYQSACDRLDDPDAKLLRRIADDYTNPQNDSDLAVKNAIDTDPAMAELKTDLPKLAREPGHTGTDDSRKWVPSLAVYRQIREQGNAIVSVQSLLDAKIRDCLVKLNKAKQTATDNGWAGAEPKISALIAPLELPDGRDSERSVQIAFVDGPALIENVETATGQWGRLPAIHSLGTSSSPAERLSSGIASAIRRDAAGRIHLDAADATAVDRLLAQWQSMIAVGSDARAVWSGVGASMPPMWTGSTVIAVAAVGTEKVGAAEKSNGDPSLDLVNIGKQNTPPVGTDVAIDAATADSYKAFLGLASAEEKSLADPMIRQSLRDHLGKRFYELKQRCIVDRANIKTDADLAALRTDLERANDEAIALAQKIPQAAAVEMWIRTGPQNQRLVEAANGTNQRVKSWTANSLPADDKRLSYPQWATAVESVGSDASAAAMTDDPGLFSRTKGNYDAWVKLVTPMHYPLATAAVLALDFPADFTNARTLELCRGVTIDFSTAPGRQSDLIATAVARMSPSWSNVRDFDQAFRSRPAITDLAGWTAFSTQWFVPAPGKLQPAPSVLNLAPSTHLPTDLCANIAALNGFPAMNPEGETDSQYTARRRVTLLFQAAQLKESGLEGPGQIKSLVCGLLLCTDGSFDWPQNKDEFAVMMTFCSNAEKAIASADNSEAGKRLNGPFFVNQRRKGWGRLASHAKTADDLKTAADLAASAGVKIDKVDEAANPAELLAGVADLPQPIREVTVYNLRLYLARKHGVLTSGSLNSFSATLGPPEKKAIAGAIGSPPAAADLRLVDDSWYDLSGTFKPAALWKPAVKVDPNTANGNDGPPVDGGTKPLVPMSNNN